MYNLWRIELQTSNGFLLLLLIRWKTIHSHLRGISIFNGNNLWCNFWGSSCCCRLLAIMGRQKTDLFLASNWEADWFLGLWNSFYHLSGLEGFLTQNWYVMNGVTLPVSCLFICNIHDDAVQFFLFFFLPTKVKNHLAAAVTSCTIKLHLVFICIWNAPQKRDSYAFDRLLIYLGDQITSEM